MEILFLVGRILFGGFFVMNAFNHFYKGAALAAYAGSKNVPTPRLAVYGSGLLILFGGFCILAGVYVTLGVWCLVLFLAAVSFKIHAFWAVSDQNMRMIEMVNFNKNMALLGGALLLLSIPEPWVYSLF